MVQWIKTVCIYLLISHSFFPLSGKTIATEKNHLIGSQPSDSSSIKIKSTAEGACAGEVVTLSVEKAIIVGDILCTDGTFVKRGEYSLSGKTAKGIIFWVDDTEKHGWALHLQEVRRCVWSILDVDIPELPNFDIGYLEHNYLDTAGYSNTKIIRQAGNEFVYPAAYAVDFEHGWYLPAARQVNVLLPEILEVNASLTIVGGTLIVDTPNSEKTPLSYWSSTEINDNRAAVGQGYQLSCSQRGKTIGHRVRAVCSF